MNSPATVGQERQHGPHIAGCFVPVLLRALPRADSAEGRREKLVLSRDQDGSRGTATFIPANKITGAKGVAGSLVVISQ